MTELNNHNVTCLLLYVIKAMEIGEITLKM